MRQKQPRANQAGGEPGETAVGSRLDALQVSGRFHRLPRKLQDDYSLGESTSWIVTWEGGLAVREETNSFTKKLGSKPYGAVVMGEQQGSWLALLNEPGFVVLEDEDGKNLQPFNDDKVLGSGINGSVRLIQSREASAKCALKCLRLQGVGANKRAQLEREVEIFLAMDHPHVARLCDVYDSGHELALVMECLSGGELFDRIASTKRFSARDAADALWQVLLAVNYIHNHHVVHRDLKLENFLFDSPGSAHLKLIDFGLSKIWEPRVRMAKSCGTLAYAAPEVLSRDSAYTSQCDLWSVGVIAYILLVGRMPFDSSGAEAVQIIQAGKYPQGAQDFGVSVPLEAQDFVRKLLVVNDASRLTAQEALQHPWIAQRDRQTEAQPHVGVDVAEALLKYSRTSRFRRSCLMISAWCLSNEERARVRDAFVEIDTSRQGTVTLPELRRVLAARCSISDESVRKVFDALDVNHDEEIEYSEFLAAMVSTRIALHDGLLDAAFHRFDQDNTGFITAENLREVLGSHFESVKVEELMREAELDTEGRLSRSAFIAHLCSDGAADSHAEAASQIIDAVCNSPAVERLAGGDREPETKRRRGGADFDGITSTAPAWGC